VYSYGNSSLRLGLSPLSPKEGVKVSEQFGGWNHTVYTVTPGIPGDSGSSNNVSDLGRDLQYMASHSAFGGVTLALGTEPFQGGLIF
jgi:hypothetical protein